ncbi:MAG: hypothetical protein H0V92_12160 [Pseudonocardiales bacterium]|nr:hypothetical protein [Pseudonocardiales bacterium]
MVEKVLVLHDALDDGQVPHAFGGALALALHVEQPRGTADIDVNISVPTERASEVLGVLPAGITQGAASVQTIERDGQVRLWWGRTPVDLFFPQHLLHQVVAGRTLSMPIGGTTVPVLSATDLTIFKALFDRTKDWADIEEMVGFGSPDIPEALAWLEEIVGADDPRVAKLRGVVPPPTRDQTWSSITRR